MTGQSQDFSLEREIDAIIAVYPSPQLALLPAVQRLASETDVGQRFVEHLARMCEVNESTVQALLVECSSPERSPESGRLCTGLSCVLNGARKILKSACDGNQEYRWMGSGIEAVGCLGCCFAAPVFVDSAGCVHQVKIAAIK
jgi:NADH:ubiquinone oxidoreductase subunit E